MGLQTASLPDRFQHLYSVIKSERFLKMQGISNEVPFFICPYSPYEEIDMQRMQRQLEKKLTNESHTKVLAINMYDISIQILKERDLWDRLLAMEESLTKEELFEVLTGVLDIKSNVVPEIERQIEQIQPDVMFINGLGEVYPYIRTHSLLDNLQSTAKAFPSIFFFPGTYAFSIDKGSYLNLFDRLNAYSYYRAFNIYHFKS